MVSACANRTRYIIQEIKKKKKTYESIRGNGNLPELLEPGLALLLGEGSGDLLEDALVLDLLGVVARGLA